MDAIVYGLIDERGQGATGTDLLSVLCAAVDADAMTRTLLRDEVLTLFLAGHETTSHALTWTFWLLSQNPEHEARLHAELDAVLGDRAPTVGDLERLPYTEAVVAESMRLYPPAYVISRMANEDAHIGEWEVPAESEVLVWIWFAHHDARWFAEPDAFRPERFLPGAPAPPACAYLPFGAGTRTCIGKRFATMEAALVVATIARRFELCALPGAAPRLDLNVTLSPQGGLPMSIRAR
jgi:cytochrome P450